MQFFLAVVLISIWILHVFPYVQRHCIMKLLFELTSQF